jgi:hypothetical protein
VCAQQSSAELGQGYHFGGTYPLVMAKEARHPPNVVLSSWRDASKGLEDLSPQNHSMPNKPAQIYTKTDDRRAVQLLAGAQN